MVVQLGHAPGSDAGSISGSRVAVLSRSLRWPQIFMIGISGTIGLGIFVHSGEILRIAGPAGALFAYGFVALVSIAVMEGIAEMIGVWPIPNPFVEFVKAFVDEDLGTVVGIAYWYAYAMVFQTLVVAAADLSDYWGMSHMLKAVVLFIACPLLLYLINYIGVWWYGLIETIGGFIKLVFVIMSFVLMMVVNHGGIADGPRIGSTYIDDGWKYNKDVASGIIPAVIAAIPLATFSFIGVELIAMTAFEAKSKESLKIPMKFIAYFIGILYFLSVTGFVLDVKWCDPKLPNILGGSDPTAKCDGILSIIPRSIKLTARTQNDPTGQYKEDHPSKAAVLIALLETGSVTWSRFVNVSLIFCVISAANTALYVSSRTLFGLTRTIDPGRSRIHRIVAKLGTSNPKTQVPAWALFTSVIAFAWLPFIHLSKGHSVYQVEQILGAIGSVAVLLVWASQCLAYIRYHHWLSRERQHLKKGGLSLRKLDRWDRQSTAYDSSFGAYFQPMWAYFGLVSCLAIVFVFSTALWWKGNVSKIPVIAAFIGPAVLLVFWLILKFVFTSQRRYVKLGDWKELNKLVNTLNQRARENMPTEEMDEEEQPMYYEGTPMQMRSPGASSGNMPAMPGAVASTPTVSDVHTFASNSDGPMTGTPWRNGTHRYYSSVSLSAREDNVLLSPGFQSDTSPRNERFGQH